MLAFGSLRCQGASQGGALCVKRCKESAQIWTKCPPSALRVQRPQLPPCIPMPQIPSSEQEQPFKSTRQTTSNDTKLQEVSRSECFLNIYIYIYTYMLNLTSCMVPLCPAHPTRNMPLPGWLAADSPFQPARKRPWLEPSPPGTVLLPSQRLQRTRRWQKINDEMLMIEMIEMVIWLLWNIFLKSPKHAPLDWVQNGCCSNVPKGFKERLPHWRRRLLSSPYGGSKKVLEMFKSLWVWEVQIFTLIQTYLWRT